MPGQKIKINILITSERPSFSEEIIFTDNKDIGVERCVVDAI